MDKGRYLLAATFGNVHGVYAPRSVVLRPAVLGEIQAAVGATQGTEKPFDLVFHGGSGSGLDDIRQAISYGVVKMNIDTDAQYAFTRPVVDHVLRMLPSSSSLSVCGRGTDKDVTTRVGAF